MAVNMSPSAHSGAFVSVDIPTVFLVEEDRPPSAALARLIRASGCEPSYCSSISAVLTAKTVPTPCCRLVELPLGGLMSQELQRLILDRSEMPVICMSERVDVQAAVRAMKDGAFEVLTKPLAVDLLVTAIRNAIERSRLVVDQLGYIRQLKERYGSLTVREREVMDLLASGRLNKQVSGVLGITEFTVKVHRSRLMRKMHAGSFAELVTMVERLRSWTGTRPYMLIEGRAPKAYPEALLQSVALASSGLISLGAS